jgi:hypothetical protein
MSQRNESSGDSEMTKVKSTFNAYSSAVIKTDYFILTYITYNVRLYFCHDLNFYHHQWRTEIPKF